MASFQYYILTLSWRKFPDCEGGVLAAFLLPVSPCIILWGARYRFPSHVAVTHYSLVLFERR